MVFDFSIPITSLIALGASLTGMWAAVTIFQKKKKKVVMVCPLRADCDKVVHSTYSKMFGIPVELLGILYYVVIGAFYSLVILWPNVFATSALKYVMMLMTLFGVILSFYFIALQAIVIKSWCSFCLLSALSSMTLALCLIGIVDGQLLDMIGSHRTWWVIIHSAGFMIGVGAATISDIFFFKFLKSHLIDEQEKENLETLSSVIWIGLAILIISGLMLFLPEQARLGESPKFLLKTVVVGVIILNGLALNMFVSPKMRQLSFEETKPARHFRRLAFALGGISIVSWYTAFILGSLRHIGGYSFYQGVLGYIIILVGVVVSSQIFERVMVKKYKVIPENYPN